MTRTLAEAATDKLRRKLLVAASDHVIVCTHVPPFIEGSFHEGKVGDPEYLALLSCPTMGGTLRETALGIPIAYNPALVQAKRAKIVAAAAAAPTVHCRGNIGSAIRIVDEQRHRRGGEGNGPCTRVCKSG